MTDKKNILDKQNVRLLDVFVVAPFLIYTATLKHSPSWVRASLLFLGFATLGYNGYHFIEESKKGGKLPKEGNPEQKGQGTKKP